MWLLMYPWTSLQYVRTITVVNAISIFTGKQSIQQVKIYCHREKRRVNIEQSNIINQYSMSLGVVDCMDQNISAHMINLNTKKLLMWPLIMLIKYIANPTQIMENKDWMLLAFTELFLMPTNAFTERVCRLKHYSLVVAACITLQTICSLTVSITGLTRAHSDSVPGCKGGTIIKEAYY